MKKIIIVDRSFYKRNYIKKLLELLGFECITVTNLNNVKKIAGNNEEYVIISDWSLN